MSTPIKLNTLGQVKCLAEGDDKEMRIGGLGAVYYDGTPGTEYEYWGVLMRLRPGSLDEAVRDDDVRCFFNHDPNWLLARNKSGTLSLSLDPKGVRYEAMLSRDDSQAASVYAKVQRGDCDGSSIMFSIVEETWEKKEDGTYIQWINKIKPLMEMGPVVFPAMKSANSAALDDSNGAEVLRRRDAYIARLAEAERRKRRRLRAGV